MKIFQKTEINQIEYKKTHNMHMKGVRFKTRDGIVNVHPSKSTVWAKEAKESSFDFFGCSPLKSGTDFTLEITRKFVFLSEYKMQVKNAAYWFYFFHLTKKHYLLFKSAVPLNHKK